MQTFSRLDLNVALVCWGGAADVMDYIKDYFKAPYDFAIINTQWARSSDWSWR